MSSAGSCSFDRVAPFYPAIEFLVFGNALTRARNNALACIADDSRVLLLGEGNGRFLSEVLRRFPNASITCVEPSAGMRTAQQKRVLKQFQKMPSTVTIVPERFQDWSSGESRFDVVVTHFFLDLFTEAEIDEIVSKIDRLVAPAGRICVAEFSEAPPKWGWFSRGLIRTMYRFFSLVANLKTDRIPNWRRAFGSCGWSMEKCSAHLCEFVLYSEWHK